LNSFISSSLQKQAISHYLGRRLTIWYQGFCSSFCWSKNNE